MTPNRASGPQNQPSASVAVSVLSGADRSIGGICPFMSIMLSGSALLKKLLLILYPNPAFKIVIASKARQSGISGLRLLRTFQVPANGTLPAGTGKQFNLSK
jgi:hypothetical protein